VKIVYFYRGVPVSTPLMHIRFIIDALRQQGHEVAECFPAVGAQGGVGTVETSGVARAKAWFRAHMPRAAVNLAQIYEARRARARTVEFCLRERPDFVYERYSIFTDAGLLAAEAVGCPLIQEVNAVYSAQHSEVFAPGFKALAERSDRHILPQADALIAVSAEVARALQECGVPQAKVTVMHNAVDPAEYQDLDRKREETRRALGLGDAFVVVVLQALDAGPFPGELLRALKEAWPRVSGTVPTARLTWIGGGSRFDWFKARVAAEVPGADRILLLGRKDHAEVPSLLAGGDVGVVLWHRAFCSPMKIFEYMAAGLPIIAPDLEGISEVVHPGENGLLFTSGEYARAAELIAGLAAAPAEAAELARRGRQYVLSRHTWGSNAAALVHIAKGLLRSAAPGGGKR